MFKIISKQKGAYYGTDLNKLFRIMYAPVQYICI